MKKRYATAFTAAFIAIVFILPKIQKRIKNNLKARKTLRMARGHRSK